VHIAKLSDIFVAAQNPTVAKAGRHLDLKMMLGFAAYSVFVVGTSAVTALSCARTALLTDHSAVR
jgi:hypothetical protein